MGTMAVVWHMSSGRGVRYPPEQHMGTMAGVCEPRKTRRMGPHPSSTWALRPESANQEKRGGCFSRGCRSWAKRGGCFRQYFCPGLRPQLKPCGPQMTLAFRPESASQAKQGGYGGDMRPQSKPCCPQRVMGISGYGFNPNKTRRVRPQSELTSCVWPKQFKYNFTETVLKL